MVATFACGCKALLVCVGVLSALFVANARITNTSVRRDGRPGILLSQPFGVSVRLVTCSSSCQTSRFTMKV